MNIKFKTLLFASVALGCMQLRAWAMEQNEDIDIKSYIKPNMLAKDLRKNLGSRFAAEPMHDGKGIIKGFVVGTSDLNDRFCNNNSLSELTIYAHYLLIDQDVKQPGVNLACLATNWFIVGEKTINLKGQDSKEHDQPQASSGKDFGESEKEKKGKSGLPGLPGESGGNFYGYGENFYDDGETFHALKSLTIDISGGKGGKGQKGGDGGIGKPGVIGEKDKATCKYRRHATEYGTGEKLLKGWFTFNNQKYEEIYQSGELGEQGGDAGKGGDGGLAGALGFDQIQTPKGDCPKCWKSIENQATGDNGGHGKPGEMGDCKLFEGIYIAEYAFASWRPIKVTENENLDEQATKRRPVKTEGLVGYTTGGVLGGAAGSMIGGTAVETTKIMVTAIATKAVGGAAVLSIGMGALIGAPLLPSLGSVFSSAIHSYWKESVKEITLDIKPLFSGKKATEWNKKGRKTPEAKLKINSEEKIRFFKEFLKK